MFNWNRPAFVGLISRPKLAAPGRHAGVLLPNGMVVHVSPDGASMVTLDEFAQGRQIRFDKAARPELHFAIQQRALLSLRGVPPYDVLSRNCEHYAAWVMGEKPESPQVGLAVVSALACLLMFVR